MNLGLIFGIILITFGAITLYLGGKSLCVGFRTYRGNFYLGLLCLSSAVWSYGFAIVFMTTSTEIAYYGRAVGMCGVFGLLILAQFMFITIAKFPKAFSFYLAGFSMMGFPVLALCVQRGAATFTYGEWGMSYVFNQGIANNIYMAFSIVYAINIAASIIFLFVNAKTSREKKMAQIMLTALVIIFCGMILDTIMPLVGYNAIPGSSITQTIGAWVICYAITEKRKTRITIENMSQYTYYAVSEPVLVFDVDGVLRLANTAADEMFNNLRAEISQNKLRIDDVFDVSPDYFDYRGKHRQDECSVKNREIEVSIETNKIYDHFKDTIGYIVSVRDVTEFKDMMNSLVEAKKNAESSNDAKSSFLMNMSHEIRTPMNSIVGLSELLLKADDLGRHRESVMDIRNASYNLLAIINDVLDISRLNSGRIEIVESRYRVADLLQDTFFAVEKIAGEKNIDFTMELDESIPCSLYGDSMRIKAVLVNLLSNGVKYTREGSVSLVGSVEKRDENGITIKYVIKDTGVGIKKEDIDKLFTAFTRIDQSVNAEVDGTGLGLAIVKGYIDLLGGTVSVNSEYGKGTEFTVTFAQRVIDDTPIGKFSLCTKKKKVETGISDVKFDGVRVLAVDDNRVNLKVISKCLETYGMDVTTAEDGYNAVSLCKEKEFDLILMDQMMPDMDGVEAMKRIRELSSLYSRGGGCMMVALTANAVEGTREQLVAAGFDGYLSKPIVFSELEEILSSRFGKSLN